MHARLTRLVACLTALAATSCIAHHPRRTFDGLNATTLPANCLGTPKEARETSIAKLQAAGTTGDVERNAVSCVAEERHVEAPGAPPVLPHKGYGLHLMEFDDDGLPWNRERVETSLESLETELRRGPAIVVVFVHGWKNDASVCNGNLSCFREVLEILSKGESAFAGASQTPRRVIGVYVGWRGGTIRTRGLNALTFWSRKHTAHVIGDNGGVTAVIGRLRSIVGDSREALERSRGRGPQTTSVVFIGHSFGGALLFSAVATSLNASVGAATQGAEEVPGGVKKLNLPVQQRAAANARPVISDAPVFVPSTGDLVVLVNPAMEASRFANLAQTRNLQFQNAQVPIFMTVASEGDKAVGGFFPIGQAFATVSRAARTRDIWFSMEKGFGLYEPYHTHRLVSRGVAMPELAASAGECRCKSNLGAYGDQLVTRLEPLYQAVREAQGVGRVDTVFSGQGKQRLDDALAGLQLAAYRETLFSRLEPVRDVDPNNPFIMASVDPKIIGGHSDIFNPAFMDFLIEYVIQIEMKRSLANDFGQRSRP